MSIKSKNIKFEKLLNNKAYHNYLSKCAATINVSSKEDFGMAALEGMAYGKPTFCLKEGGYLETTKHNHNAIHINKNNIYNDLAFKLVYYDRKKLINLEKNCKKTAEKYSKDKFLSKIKKLMVN